MLTSSGGRSMLTVADRGRGLKFAKILLTSYVNAPFNGVDTCQGFTNRVLVRYAGRNNKTTKVLFPFP